MKASQVITTCLAFCTISTAWPWGPSVEDIKGLTPASNPLHRRQDDSSSSSESKSSPPSKTTASDSQTSNSNTKSSSASQKSGKSSSATKTSSVSINPAAGAGGVALITPATTLAASQYYKVDNTITWVWNYTSLTSPPAAIDILATLAPQGQSAVPSPYTIATNITFDKTQTFMWDTGEYTSNTSPLPVGTYTLLVYDAALPTWSATASPGFLGLYNQFAFGMYTGQPRVDLTDPFVCATCNAANSSMEKTTIRFLLGMVGITVVTFTWFAGAWGLF